MTSFLSIIVSFVLTGVAANWLIHLWQQRNWLYQQRFLGREKEYFAFRDLTDEIAGLLGTRVYYMKRLCLCLKNASDTQFAERVTDYEGAVRKWNENLASFYGRLSVLANHSLVKRLEDALQHPMKIASDNIDVLIRKRHNGTPLVNGDLAKIQEQLNHIQARTNTFLDDLLAEVEKKRREVYYGMRIRFTRDTLEKFSSWNLFKALFVSNINSFSIVRTSVDFHEPI